MVDRFAVNWRTARLDEATRELLEYTERLTARPASVDAADIERLRYQGFDDAAISSCV